MAAWSGLFLSSSQKFLKPSGILARLVPKNGNSNYKLRKQRSDTEVCSSGGQCNLAKTDSVLLRNVPVLDEFERFVVLITLLLYSVRCMSGHKTLTITASRWQWHKTKDWLHFYFFVGAIPISIFVFVANVFVGPATLEPIPEGYVPKHWEYYRSPVVRLFARYLFSQPQKEYEKGLHFIVHDMEVKQVRDLQRQVKEYIRNEQDYPAFGYHSGIQATMVKEYRKRIDEQRM